MKSLLRTACAAGLGLCLAACAPIQDVQDNLRDSGARLDESHLGKAGFKLLLADTMEKQKLLNELPPDTLTHLQKEGADYYIYPDPDGCVCLYVGRDIEYQRLQQLAAELQLSNQQLMANDMAENARSGWGAMGPWGNWGNSGYYGNNPGRPNWDPH